MNNKDHKEHKAGIKWQSIWTNKELNSCRKNQTKKAKINLALTSLVLLIQVIIFLFVTANLIVNQPYTLSGIQVLVVFMLMMVICILLVKALLAVIGIHDSIDCLNKQMDTKQDMNAPTTKEMLRSLKDHLDKTKKTKKPTEKDILELTNKTLYHQNIPNNGFGQPKGYNDYLDGNQDIVLEDNDDNEDNDDTIKEINDGQPGSVELSPTTGYIMDQYPFNQMHQDNHEAHAVPPHLLHMTSEEELEEWEQFEQDNANPEKREKRVATPLTEKPPGENENNAPTDKTDKTDKPDQTDQTAEDKTKTRSAEKGRDHEVSQTNGKVRGNEEHNY